MAIISSLEKDREEELKRIKDEVLTCQKCPLYKDRIKNKFYPVIGEGNHQTKIMFVGEAPGLNEARTARPFCGAAGKILDELLNSVGIERKEIYISNIIKCRPPNNRDPLPEEIKACSPYIERQINIIKPKVICSLGRYSMRFLMEKFGLADKIQSISKIHGRVFKIKNLFDAQGLSLIPFYHPAVAAYHYSMKAILKTDFQILKKFS